MTWTATLDGLRTALDSLFGLRYRIAKCSQLLVVASPTTSNAYATAKVKFVPG